MGMSEAVGEFFETLTPLELKRVIAKGHILQEDFRRMLAELEKDIAEAERLLKVEEQEPR